MSKIDNTDCSHNFAPEEIDLSMTNGEEDQEVCEAPNRLIADVLKERMGIQIGQASIPNTENLNTSNTEIEGTDIESIQNFQRVVQKLETEIILHVMATLASKKVISPSVYKNAVDIILKQ